MAANKTDEAKPSAAPEARETDLTKSGRANTVVETQTQVVDNTTATEERRPVDYEVAVEKLSGGHVRHTYGEPVGGFPQDSEDA